MVRKNGHENAPLQVDGAKNKSYMHIECTYHHTLQHIIYIYTYHMYIYSNMYHPAYQQKPTTSPCRIRITPPFFWYVPAVGSSAD